MTFARFKVKVTLRESGECVFSEEYLTIASSSFRKNLYYQVCADYPEASNLRKYRIYATELCFNGSTYEIW